MSLCTDDCLVCRFGWNPNGHLYRVTYSRCHIGAINSPDYGHMDGKHTLNPEFYVLLTMHLNIIFVSKQLDAQFFSCMFISILYMFQAAMCPSSGELIVSIQHQVYVSLYRWPFCVQIWIHEIQTWTPNGHLWRVTFTWCCIDTINSPDDGQMAAWNM
jgi:hypothetical protein